MPLSDRDYMRRSPPPARAPRDYGGFGLSPVWVIIIVNLMFFMATLVSGEGRYPFGDYHEVISDKFTYYLGLIPYYFMERPWTIITSMFVHAGTRVAFCAREILKKEANIIIEQKDLRLLLLELKL